VNGNEHVLAMPSAITGAPQQLGHLGELRQRVAVRHRVARDDQRVLRLGQELGGARDRRAITDDARRDARGRAEIQIALGIQHVDRQ